MPLKILIADDNALTVEGILHHIHFDEINTTVVQACYDGLSALRYAQNHDVDIVISDIKMPGLTGLEMAKRLLSQKPSIRIIFISAYEEYQFARDSIRLGAVDYVEKPVDYSRLTETIQKASMEIQEENETRAMLNVSRDALMQQFLQTLVHVSGDAARSQLEQLGPHLQIPSDASYFSCNIVRFQNIEHIQQTQGILRVQYLRLQLRAFLEEQFQPGCILFCNDRDTFVVLLCIQAPSVDMAQRCIRLYCQKVEGYLKASALKVNIGVGCIVDCLWSARVSYENARSLLQKSFFLTDTILFENSQLEEESKARRLMIPEHHFDEAILDAICQRDETRLMKTVQRMVEESAEYSDGKMQLFATIHATMGRLLKTLWEFDLQVEGLQANIQHMFAKIDSFPHSEALREALMDIFTKALRLVSEGWDGGQRQFVQKAVDCIDAAYGDSKLSVSSIAAHVNVSASHLGALFRRYQNDTLTGYLTRTRLQKARALLLSSSLSIKEISERVGFTSQYYFSSCYKKHMGISPSAERVEHSADAPL